MRIARALLPILLLACPSWAGGEAAPQKPFFNKPITLGAHRGGMGLYPEETLLAYRSTAEKFRSLDVILEGDVHLTADGEVVLMHDAAVDRTTDGTGRVSKLPWDEVRRLDAGYRFTLDGGATFPHRGKGLRVPTLKEALKSQPDVRWQIEIKGSKKIAAAALKVIDELKASDRILIASMFADSMALVREQAPSMARCFDPASASELLKRLRGADWDNYAPTADVLATSPGLLKNAGTTKEEISAIKKKGIHLQFFTINDPEEMKRLLELGADGLLTDRPDLLAALIIERGDSIKGGK